MDNIQSQQPTSIKNKLRLLFSRLRSHLETQTMMDGVGQSQREWRGQGRESGYYPADNLLLAAQHFGKAGDPRAEILNYHADMMDGLKADDPHYQHANTSPESVSLGNSRVPLPDGSTLRIGSLGHSIYPGVHAVTVSWTPHGSGNTYFSHWHPDEARGLADRFGAAHAAVGDAIHGALDRGEEAAAGGSIQFSRVEQGDFHQTLAHHPDDRTSALAYSDWLEEQGKPGHAALVRSHVTHHGTGAHYSTQIPYEMSDWPNTASLTPVWGNVQEGLGRSPDQYQVGITEENPQPSNTNHTLFWQSAPLSAQDALQLSNQLAKEGKKVRFDPTSYKEGLQVAKNARKEQPVRMEAYRSPSPSGMVVDNLYYPPGSLVPDLQKEEFSADAGKKKKKKPSKWGRVIKKIKGSTSFRCKVGEAETDSNSSEQEGAV